MSKLMNKKAQSTVEYLIMVAAAIGAFLIFMNPLGGPMENAINASLDININSMLDMSNRIFN